MGLTDLFPGKWVVYAGILAVAFASGGTAAWKFQSMRYAAKENERVQQVLANERSAAKAALRRFELVAEADRKATTRLVAARNDAAATRDVLTGMLGDTARYLQGARTDHATCLTRADTLGELFTQCSGRLETLAATADRHTVDVLKCQESWP